MEYSQHMMGERRLHHTEMRQKATLRDTFFGTRDERTMSVATEFVDMDWDEDIMSDCEDNSPRHSVNSSGGQPSITTLSSYDEAPTPRHSPSRRDVDADWSQSVEGPTGPHLFRNSLIQNLEDHAILTLSPITPKTARPMDEAFNLPIFHEPLPMRRYSGPFAFHRGRLDASGLVDWTPEMVAQSMLDAGMEQTVAERFVENDISGAILMTLKFEDLKELSIQSFGIRTKVWNQIQILRDSRPSSPRAPTPIQDEPSKEVRREVRSPEDTGMKRCRSTRRRPKNPSHEDLITPLESVSIVGIEQVIPEPHFCSKGEKCSTYKKRQRIIEEVRRLNPNADIQSGAVVISGDPGNPLTARALDPHEMIRPFSEANTSVVASSDVLGPGNMAPIQYLQEATLRNVLGRDPQENVRQFLDFQQCASNEVPPTPPFEMLPSAMAPKQGLRTLPKLAIPGQHSAPNVPSRLSHQVTRTPEPQQQQIEEFVPYQMDKADPLSPDLAIRNPYRFGTPFSEMDVPVTAQPVDRIERNISQSVPPEMNYHSAPSNPPPTRTMSRASARRPSFPVMPALNEHTPIAARHSPSSSSPQRASVAPQQQRRQQQQQPQQQPAQAPPRATYPWSQQTAIPVRQAAASSTGSLTSAETAGSSSNGITYSGHMKKRRTRMLRHEWNDGYFTLKGTRLAMHKDAVTIDRSLEYVDIDDYAIACSSLASQSKLSAAFKRVQLLSGSSGAKDTDSVGAFAFQLVPQNGVPTTKLRKRESGFSFSSSSSAAGPDGVNGTGKTHHFAVKNRDERIDWMRELMLAKALRQKGEGFEVNRNGNQI